MTYERRSFSGAAVATTIPAGIPDAVGLGPFTVGATVNWPNTTTGPFIVSLNIGLADEEKVKVASYTSTSFTCVVGGRGWDGTTAQSHAGAVTVACTLDANTVDALNSFANLNGTVVGSTSAVGDTATTGTSSAPAAADHKHAREAFGTDVAASAVGDTGGNGSGTTVAHSNHQHPRESAATLTAGLAYGSVTPAASAVGDAAAPGTATTPARADHKHAREAFGAPVNSAPGDVAAQGSATTVARSDHKHGREAVPAGLTLAAKLISSPSYSTNTGSYQIVDASNAFLTFTVPASGIVIIEESGLWNNNALTVMLQTFWSTSTSNNTGLVGNVGKSGSIDGSTYKTLCHYITGLTPGANQTLYLQWSYTNLSGTVTVGNGADLLLRVVGL